MNPVSSTYFLFDGISLAVLNSLMPQGFLERPYTWKNVKQISKDNTGRICSSISEL
jgi:hypothetical protein